MSCQDQDGQGPAPSHFWLLLDEVCGLLLLQEGQGSGLLTESQ